MRSAILFSLFCPTALFAAGDLPRIVDVEGQPLGAGIGRLIQALDFLGAPLSKDLVRQLNEAAQKRDSRKLQQLLDPQVTFVVSLNPEVRVKVDRGPGSATIQQGGFAPLLIKVINDSTVTRQLRIASPQAGPVYSGTSLAILKRQAQTELKVNENTQGKTDRFLEVDLFQKPPMTGKLSGLEVEYAIALIYSQESGKREATIEFNVGAGTQDLGFRGEVPVLFDIRPAIAARLKIRDFDGSPTTARLTIRDRAGRIYPPQAKRLAPDFFFQKQVYRHDRDVILLPPGEFQVQYSRGPEYHVLTKTVRTERPTTPRRKIPTGVDLSDGAGTFTFDLKRWVDPAAHGFYSGDHHIHGAGCSHYESPTEGVRPIDMFAQVKGEGLNVGCILTWGPCFDFQRNYFNPTASRISEPFTLIKYDLEISGFGSAALGHVCLLNLKNQTYPESEGTKTKGWPTWTVPVLKWCKDQGGVTGYPHSAKHVNAASSAKRWLDRHDPDRSASISRKEASALLMPEPFEQMDADDDGSLTERELVASFGRAANRLPNLAVPDMSGGGALEICVSTAEGVCDFISAMDTARIPEWNTWYHLMNCGFPLKLSGETDFPCMSSRRVGQGRVYVQLGEVDKVDFTAWCSGIAAGRSYVSDGYAHALHFDVDGRTPGTEDVALKEPGTVTVSTTVAFAPRTPVGVAYGNVAPAAGRRMLGDTIHLHAPRSEEFITGGQRRVEVVVNGQVVASGDVPADGSSHDLEFDVEVTHSSWVAVRQFPQLHSNPVNVIVGDKPIRASADSARWCIETIHELWRNRSQRISEPERPAARAAYDRAIRRYQQIIRETR